MSDDSHATDQVGTNYPRLLEFIQATRIPELYYAAGDSQRQDIQVNGSRFTRISVDDVAKLPYWTANN